MRHTTLILLGTLALASVLSFVGAKPAPEGEPAPPTTYVLVRHTERADNDPRDPDLSEAGLERADRLAHMLSSIPISAVYSTDYARTRQTAAPLASLAKLEIETYDPRSPAESLASIAREHAGEGVLIVGHSNTIPDLVRRLGGEAPMPEFEHDEYDNVFIVTVLADGRVITHRLHS